VIPLSLERRLGRSAPKAAVARHILVRAGLLVAVGLFLNAYPAFDLPHLRIPGVLQRIGLCYGLVALFLLAVSRSGPGGRLRLGAGPIAVSFIVVVLSYAALLHLVPVPGFGAGRFDPVGAWPAVVDRQIFGEAHMFPWWPVDGRVVFDPEGVISTWPACATVLLGALVGRLRSLGALPRPILVHAAGGAALMLLALALGPWSPIIKNIWSPTFILFSGGFSLASLAVLEAAVDGLWLDRPLFPARVFGANPFLAYLLSFAIAPLWDLNWLSPPNTSLRGFGQASLSRVLEPHLASLVFSLLIVGLIFAVLLVAWRRNWFLKL